MVIYFPMGFPTALLPCSLIISTQVILVSLFSFTLLTMPSISVSSLAFSISQASRAKSVLMANAFFFFDIFPPELLYLFFIYFSAINHIYSFSGISKGLKKASE